MSSRGADVNMKEISEMTPLFFASSSGHTELVHLLVSKGANIHNKDNFGRTALFYGKPKD